uniref:Uncharacterized protein n=1 Tax=Papio anubis TaxID=9555 RepID=A0A8I5NG55_PAPAN
MVAYACNPSTLPSCPANFCIFCRDRVSPCPGWPQTPELRGFSCLGLPMCWDYRYPPPCPANFVFLVETGFHHVGQVGLELLTSSDPPVSASQSGLNQVFLIPNKTIRPV